MTDMMRSSHRCYGAVRPPLPLLLVAVVAVSIGTAFLGAWPFNAVRFVSAAPSSVSAYLKLSAQFGKWKWKKFVDGRPDVLYSRFSFERKEGKTHHFKLSYVNSKWEVEHVKSGSIKAQKTGTIIEVPNPTTHQLDKYSVTIGLVCGGDVMLQKTKKGPAIFTHKSGQAIQIPLEEMMLFDTMNEREPQLLPSAHAGAAADAGQAEGGMASVVEELKQQQLKQTRRARTPPGPKWSQQGSPAFGRSQGALNKQKRKSRSLSDLAQAEKPQGQKSPLGGVYTLLRRFRTPSPQGSRTPSPQGRKGQRPPPPTSRPPKDDGFLMDNDLYVSGGKPLLKPKPKHLAKKK